MTYLTLGTALALAWFVIVNVAVSLAAATALRAAARPGARSEAHWFWLRLSPTIVATMFVATVFVPSFVRFEPRDTNEPLGVVVGVLALAGLALIARGMTRALKGWRRASRQARIWRRAAEPLAVPDVPVPVYAIRHPHPIVTLVGIIRPRLFVSRRVVEALAADELRAVIGHEIGHCTAWDNLKRLVLLASPDALALVPVGGDLESRWTSAAETRADRFAVGGDAGRALALSSALLKVARLMPGAPRLHAPVSSLDDGGLLTRRVRQLLAPAAPPRPAGHRVGWVATGLAVAVASTTAVALVAPVYRLSEWLVHLAG